MGGIDFLCIGNPFADRFAQVEEEWLVAHDLPIGMATVVDDSGAVNATWVEAGGGVELSLGGTGTNVTKTLAQLGHKCALHGRVGSDEFGRSIVERLNRIGVQCLLIPGSKGTGRVNCFISGKQRTFHTYIGSAGELCGTDLALDHFAGARHVHHEGYSAFCPGVLSEGLELSSGRTTSLDLASANVVALFQGDFRRYATKVDILFGNVQEMHALTESETYFGFFSADQIVVATDGENGCYVKGKGETAPQHFGALKVDDVVDTTGAGDGFCAGFLHGYLSGKSMAKCVAMGNMIAGETIRQIGTDLPPEAWQRIRRSFEGALQRVEH
jgi:sugar/nucleoside kinase (ribokinase family)